MADDFFADLVPIKAQPGPQAPGSERAQTRQPWTPGALPAGGRGSAPTEVPDLLGAEAAEGVTSHIEAPKAPVPPTQSQVKQFEDAVEATVRRFASGLQRVLEDINRRLESLETQTERLGKALSDTREVDILREGAFKDRFGAIDKDLRDIQRGVQLVRDKQEVLEAQAELARLSAAKKVEEGQAALKPVPAAAVKVSAAPGEAPAPTPGAASQASVEMPTAEAPPLPAPTVPPMPTSIHSAAPPSQQPPQAPPPQARAPQYTAPKVNQQPQYVAPAVDQQPQHSAPAVQQVPQGQQLYSSAAQPAQPPAQGYPPQQAQQPHASLSSQVPQYSAPPPSQQYSAPPPPKPFSAPPQQNFQPQAPAYSGSSGGSHQAYGGGPPHSGIQTGYPSGYPNLPQPQPQPSLPNAPPPPHRYPSGGVPAPPPNSGSSYGRHDYGPPPPRTSGSYREPGSYGGGHSTSRPPNASGQTASRNIPLEQVIDDVANMGFSRHDVRAVVSELMERGQAVDLNIVLDRLMNGPRR